MKRFAFLLSLIAALAACGGNDPVADKGTTVPDNVVGDASSDGLSAPANAAAAEAHVQAAQPLARNGERWIAKGRNRLDYGPVTGATMLAFECDTSAGSPTLVVVREGAAPKDGMATMSFTGGGHVASLPMHAAADGDHGYMWRGTGRHDELAAVADTFAGEGAVEIKLGTTADLVVPSTPEVRALLARCG